MPLQVFETCCKNCLLSPDRIVDGKRAKQIVNDCIRKQTHFICHKATMNGHKEILCRTFFDSFGHMSQMVRIAGRLNMIEFVPQTDGKKLPTWNEMRRPKKIVQAKAHEDI